MNNAFPALGTQAATRQTYERTGAWLANRLSVATGSTDPSMLVAEFLVSARKFSQTTFRLYKASLLEHLGSSGVPPSVLHTLINASSKDCVKSSERTSGLKAKTVQAADQLLLINMLRSRRSLTSSLAADYFQAGLIAGPRPVEWTGAELTTLEGNKPVDAPANATHMLTLPNAKRDEVNIRGNGATRTVYLSVSAVDAAVIIRVIADARSHSHDWARHYHSLRGALRYTAKSLWPRRKRLPGFYTTRHQSQADAKASGRRPNEIAAMFGHASDKTSTQHYARASQGDKNIYKMAPTAASLAKVRNQKVTAKMLARGKSSQKVV